MSSYCFWTYRASQFLQVNRGLVLFALYYVIPSQFHSVGVFRKTVNYFQKNFILDKVFFLGSEYVPWIPLKNTGSKFFMSLWLLRLIFIFLSFVSCYFQDKSSSSDRFSIIFWKIHVSDSFYSKDPHHRYFWKFFVIFMTLWVYSFFLFLHWPNLLKGKEVYF